MACRLVSGRSSCPAISSAKLSAKPSVISARNIASYSVSRKPSNNGKVSSPRLAVVPRRGFAEDKRVDMRRRDHPTDIFDAFERMMLEPFTFPAFISGNETNAERPRTVTPWRPPVDISESKDSYNIHMEVPGIRKEDVKIEVDEGVLTVKGERKWEKKEEDKERRYSRVERQYGTFIRRFPLPKDVEAQRIKASYKDGVLDIAIPRSTEKTKGIEIKVE